MTKLECLRLLERVRADYVAVCRDNHGLKRLVKPFDTEKLPLIEALDKGIRDMRLATMGDKE